MAYESATNPTTGEKLFLVGDKWVPPSETATNPKTGQRAFLINNEWQVLDAPKAAPTAAPAVTEQPTNIISPEEITTQAEPVVQPSTGLTEQQKRQLAEATAKYEAEVPFLQRITDPLKAGFASAKGIVPGVQVANIQKEINLIQEGKATDPIGRPLSAEAAEARLKELQGAQAQAQQKLMGTQAEAAQYQKRPTIQALGDVKTARQAFDAFQVDPLGVMASVSLESVPQIVPALVLGAVTRSPKVGAMAMGSTSFASELSSGITEYFQEQGVDVKDPTAVNKALNDPALFAKAYEHAMTRASIIGVADTAAAGLASKMLVPKKVIKNQVAKEAVNIGVAQPAAQMISGGGGEAVAQLVTEGEIKKPGQVLLETAGQGPSSLLETAAFGGQQAYERLPSTIAKREAEAKAAEDQKKILDKLNAPGAMDKLGEEFNAQVEKLKAAINPDTKKPYTEQEAYDAAGDAILQKGLLDGTESTISGTDKSSVSVPSEPSETDTRIVDTAGGNLGAAGATTTAVGGGEGTELNTLAAELKAKYPQMTDAQATAAATESLRQKQIAAGQQAATGAPTPPAITAPQNLIDLYAKSVAADEANNVSSTPANKRNATMAARRLGEAKAAQLGLTYEDYLKESDPQAIRALDDAVASQYNQLQDTTGKTIEFGEWRDIGKGYQARQSSNEPLQEIKTPDGNILIRGVDANGKEYMEYESGTNPLEAGGMDWVAKAKEDLQSLTASTTTPATKMGKSPGRPKTDKTPEQIAAAAEYRRQRQAIGRNASAEVDKVEKVLNRVVDEQAIIDSSGTEKEAQDTLYELRQGRIDALSVAYGLSVNPDQKNKTAGKRATALLDKADPQERELGKLRHEAKQRLGAPSRSEIIESTNGQDNAAFEKFNNAKGAINYIARSGNPFEKALAQRLAPFLNGVKFVVIDNAADMPTPRLQSFMDGAAGLFDPETKTIYVMREGGINNTVVLHEALHAATIAKINTYILLKNAKKPIPNDLRVAVAELYETMDEAKRLYDQLEDAGMLLPEMEAIPYVAFTDVKEFVAYGLSLPAMQDFLLAAPGEYAGEAPGFISKLFNKFVQSLRKMFNMDEKHKSALQDLMIVTNKLLDISITPEQEAAAMGEPSQAKAKKQPAPPKAPKPPKQLKLVETLLRKIRLSNRSSELNGSIGELIMQVRNASDAIRLMKAIYSAVDVNKLRLVLRAFTTEDITRIAGDRINNLKVINDAVDDMAGMRVQMIRELAEKTPAWVNFNQKYEEGGRILADLISASTLLEVDPTKYPDAATALKNDSKLQRIEKDILNPPVNPKTNKPKSISSLKKERTERIAEIKLVYEGGAYNNPITGEKSTMGGWEKLGKFGKGEGHAIYKMAKDSYKNTFDMHEQLLKEKIESSNVPGNVNDASTPKGKLIAAITKTFQEAKLLEVYFPLMRYGNFWFSVGKGKSGEFYMFEGTVARNSAIEARVAELNRAGDKRTKDEMIADGDIDVGDDIRKLREKHIESSDMLKEIFAMLDQNKMSDIDAVKDNIYQMYLMTLPDKDIRRKFVHRQGKTGFSADAIRNFITSQHTAANQLARLKYSDKIRNGIAAAYAEIQQNPDKLKLAAIIREVSNRAINEITPTVPEEGLDWDQVASIGNKFVFYWLLTSPKSALVQMTQLPIVGLPTLGAEFGIGKATATAARYGSLWGKFGTTKKDENGDVITAWGQPSINDSKYVNEHPNPAYRKVLKDAWNFANDKDIFMSTYAGDMTAMSAVPSARYQGVISRGTRFVFDLMGGAFHHAERISREIMYMSAFELAYADAKQKGMDGNAAFDAATKKALKLTYDALFNYTQYNKPPPMKTAGGRLAFQFLTYPLQMTSYLVRNFYGMLPFLNKEEKKDAAIKFFGTLGMTGLFAGVTGFPLYSFIMGMAEGVRELMRDEEDEDYDEDDEGNPLGKRSLDLWFRNSFIPSYFGPDSSLANFFNLTEEQAATLARGVEMGPISAYTDLNVGTSTSLDGLWFRSDAPAETSREAFQNFVFSFTGPIGSVGANFAGAFDDFNKGQINRGFEKLSPAWLKGGLTAMRLKEEGATTTKGDELMNPEFYTTGKLLAQTLGFGSTEVAQVQKANFTAKKIVTEINREKQNILNRLDAAVRQNDDDKIDKMLEEIDKFNTKNGMLAINGETVSKSLQARSERRGKAYQGLSVSDKEAPFVYPLVEGTRSPQYK
jgi:hypothetical protein